LRDGDDGKCIIEIDPGLSFGSGHHFTTISCLQFIDRIAEEKGEGLTFCDLGCGSGILSIAAHKLGFRDVLAVDNSPAAMTTLYDNVETNGIGADEVETCVADLDDLSFCRESDVVAANVLATVLAKCVSGIVPCVREGGVLLLSGIMADEYERVVSLYKDMGMVEKDTLSDGEWKSGWFERQSREV